MTLQEAHRRDTRANQPAATTAPPGTLYAVTDEGYRLERSSGTAWELYAPAALGQWSDVPFTAAHFTAAAPMTWTVTAGQVVANRYTLLGKTLVWSCFLSGTTLGGTASASAVLQVPGGFTHPAHNPMPAAFCADSGGLVAAYVAYHTGSQVVVARQAGGNWALGAFAVQFTVILEIA